MTVSFIGKHALNFCRFPPFHGQIAELRGADTWRSMAVGRTSQLVVGNSANPSPLGRARDKFWQKSPIGMTLEKKLARIGGSSPRVRKKGDWTMSGFKFERQLIAAFAALLMSTIAVGAAVAPAQVSAATVEVVTYA